MLLVCSLGKTLLAFALLHSIVQGQICLLLQVFLDFLLLQSGCDRPCRSAAERSYPTSDVGVAAQSYPMPEVRSSGREEQPHIQGAVVAQVQESQEELLHVQGQKGRL